MRITVPAPVTLQASDAHTLTFAGQRHETINISVLDHDLIRVQHRPDGAWRLNRTWSIVDPHGDMPREGRSRDDLAPFPLPPFALAETGGGHQIQTDHLRLTIALDELNLTWADSAGREFASDLNGRAYAYDQRGRSVFHYMRRRADEHYYGFGERAGKLDKRGMRMRMLNVDAFGYNAEASDPLYKHLPFYITFVPELNIAYGLFYDNLATTVFDMGKEIDAFWGDYRYYHAADGDLDYYMIYGPTIEQVVEKFTALTGRPLLPPRWTLGFMGSTMKYTEAPDAQDQLKRFVELCREHDIPCDLFHLSSGYTTNNSGQRCVFTWNRQRIPEPRQMVAHFHGAHIRLAANIKPYLLKVHPNYDAVARIGGFVADSETDQPAASLFWSGGPYEKGAGAYVDFTSDAGYGWWQERVTTQLLDYGIDVMWNDNNEFEIWDDEARCDGFGQPIPISMARPLQTLLMAHASFSATQAHKPDERAFLLTRAGCPGIQRYAQTWSGDNGTSWHTLQYNIPMGLGLSLSGMPNTGHDVGGFFGPAPEPELFIRWVQNGIFHPRFTIHSWNSDGTVNEPWMYPEALPHIRAAMRLRYQLIPYLYTLFVEAARTGHPIIRPLVYHFPEDPSCRAESFDFMLGRDLLVASVFEPGARGRAVYLPEGTQWCDFYNGQWHTGGQTIDADAPLERIPLFVRAGGMIPMGKPMRHAGEQADDVRRLLVFPPPATTATAYRYSFTEDDGISLKYRQGEFTEVDVRMVSDADSVHIRVDARGDYPLPYQQIEIVLPPGETRPVTAEGFPSTVIRA